MSHSINLDANITDLEGYIPKIYIIDDAVCLSDPPDDISTCTSILFKHQDGASDVDMLVKDKRLIKQIVRRELAIAKYIESETKRLRKGDDNDFV